MKYFRLSLFRISTILSLLILTCPMAVCAGSQTDKVQRKPNIIFILADDLAIGDIGPYSQTKIQTPVLDKIAREGVRFTQGYSGTSVCAPSRASLITGLHTGHCPIRGNKSLGKEGQMPLSEETYTVAKLLKSSGYATLCAGKWGMGMFDTTGSPLKQGFDNFYGFNCQKHAHDYFPKYLYENDKRVDLNGKAYAPDFIINHTLQWIRQHQENPFFLFFSTTLPHGKYEIDDPGLYKDKADWTDTQKTYAAMCTRLDTQIGQIPDLLKELNLDENTIIFFAGDNGSSFSPDSPNSVFFNSNDGLRGFKRTMYEGGLRNAFLARWTKHIAPGTVENTPIAFWDFLPTCADLADTNIPEGTATDGVSILPLLLEGNKPDRDKFYWELHEGQKIKIQAVRWKDWKFIKNGPNKSIELYDLKSDPYESNNLANENSDLIKTGEELLRTLRSDSPDWHLNN